MNTLPLWLQILGILAVPVLGLLTFLANARVTKNAAAIARQAKVTDDTIAAERKQIEDLKKEVDGLKVQLKDAKDDYFKAREETIAALKDKAEALEKSYQERHELRNSLAAESDRKSTALLMAERAAAVLATEHANELHRIVESHQVTTAQCKEHTEALERQVVGLKDVVVTLTDQAGRDQTRIDALEEAFRLVKEVPPGGSPASAETPQGGTLTGTVTGTVKPT